MSRAPYAGRLERVGGRVRPGTPCWAWRGARGIVAGIDTVTGLPDSVRRGGARHGGRRPTLDDLMPVAREMLVMAARDATGEEVAAVLARLGGGTREGQAHVNLAARGSVRR
ncbi:hypothetical protein ABZV34_39520, partial [Streptomyces sp. NPDC005195]|uniref:hypothetical protein n=1 Tax=Streptomyces sp. NPDC005195 TaxID=3154561 RepID=UPI0033B7421E